MSTFTKRNSIVALALGAFAFTTLTLPAAPKKELTEDELITELAGPNEDKVANAMLQLEKRFPTSTKGFPAMKNLLADSREKVRRKAARVLGILHAEVSEADLKNITAMFKTTNPLEALDALKSLRGLKAKSTLPEIVALLKNDHPGIVRDALRTLAILGDKSQVAAIEPLLQHSDKKVQKDAQDAIFALKNKS